MKHMMEKKESKMMEKKEMKSDSESPSKSKKSTVSDCPPWEKGKCIGPHKGLTMMKDANK